MWEFHIEVSHLWEVIEFVKGYNNEIRTRLQCLRAQLYMWLFLLGNKPRETRRRRENVRCRSTLCSTAQLSVPKYVKYVDV